MFGFLNPEPHTTFYRRVYSRCCQFQRSGYGLLSLPFLSYESIFLYLYAAAAGQFDVDGLPGRTCCRLRRDISHHPIGDACVGQFCSSLGMLLASIKLQDDLRDEGTLETRIIIWILKKRFEKAFTYFQGLGQNFDSKIQKCVSDHLEMESTGYSIALSDYARPTSEAFGYTFGLMAQLPGLQGHKASLILVGERIGAAILAYDCAVDWKHDKKRGNYNPLSSEEDVQYALNYCLSNLYSAI